MRRKHPRTLGSLRNPLPLQTSPLCIFPSGVHLFPSQPSSLHPALRVNPLSVFCPTSFPPLKNTSYFPTLMMAMPSSSCVTKLSTKRPAIFQPSPSSSTLIATSPIRSLLERSWLPSATL
uniref:Predicted gene 5142 n=1 Tax=Cricetulus griseus TaxID=10029 RepID=A0A8C2MBC3_CRIGR